MGGRGSLTDKMCIVKPLLWAWLFYFWGVIRQLDYIVIYLLFQDSFQVDLFDYVCDLLTGLALRFTFCPTITLNLICFTGAWVTSWQDQIGIVVRFF